MDSVYSWFLTLAGLPLLVYVFSFIGVIIARRNRDLSRDEWTAGTFDRRAESSRLILTMSLNATKFIYGFVQAFFLAVWSGSLSGILPALDLGLNLPVYCTVFGGINVLAVLADSMIVAGAIKKEALANAEGFRKTIIKLCIVEFLAVCGLLASTLLIIYQNT